MVKFFLYKRFLLFWILILICVLGILMFESRTAQKISADTICPVSKADVMILIDTSGSMADKINGISRKIDQAKASATSFVNLILGSNTGNSIGLVHFSNAATLDSGLSTFPSILDRDIANLFPGGITCAACGLQTSNQELYAHGMQGRKKVVIFLTDGIANAIPGDSHQVSSTVAENAANVIVQDGINTSQIVYYTIGLGNDVNTSFLQNIANMSGGHYYFSATGSDLQNIYSQISQSLGVGSLSGQVYDDANKDLQFDSGDKPLPGQEVDIYTPGNLTPQKVFTGVDGTYALNNVCYGEHDIKLPIPSGYQAIYPQNATQPTYRVMLGSPCQIIGNTTQLGAACDSKGNLIQLNFAVISAVPWYQSYCGDVRLDSGVNNLMPPSAVCGNGISDSNMISTANPLNVCQKTTGVVYSTSSFDFGSGSPSKDGYVSGASFTSRYVNTTQTSYDYVHSKATASDILPVALEPFCTSNNLSNCSLSNLSHGLYEADPLNGTMVLHTYTFPDNQNFVILVNGDLDIDGNIMVPIGSTATFIVKGSIHIMKMVGSDSSSIGGNIEGFYSSDHDLVIDGTGTCQTPDMRLNLQGSFIVNAAYSNPPGQFSNQRSLCTQDVSCPSVTFAQRPDLILNTPGLLRTTNSLFQEVLP